MQESCTRGACAGQKSKKVFVVCSDKAEDTRFSEILTGVLSKGVWWMPRLKKAMKDAA
jgi:hypothetical protein